MKALARNREATYNYEPLETYEAGIELLGTEVKSVKAGNLSLRGAFITIKAEEAYLTNATIPPWQPRNTASTYDPNRARKLLLKKHELAHLMGSKQQQGLTIIPLRVYTKGPYVKLEIALARGRKRHNKKEVQRERDIKRETERILRGKDV